MAFARKGSRSIVIDGLRYRWKVKYESVDWCSAVCPVSLIVVSESEENGRCLIAKFNSVAKSEDGTEWLLPRYGAEVTPGKVADIIRKAMELGWIPNEKGQPAFEMDGEPFLAVTNKPVD